MQLKDAIGLRAEKKKMGYLLENRFLRFLAVGGLNTVFGYTVYVVLIYLGFHYALAVLLTTVLGVLFNFKTTGSLVFGSRNNRLIFRFVGAYAAICLMNIAALKVFKSFDVDMYLAGALVILPMAMVAFLLNRRFVFGGQG